MLQIDAQQQKQDLKERIISLQRIFADYSQILSVFFKKVAQFQFPVEVHDPNYSVSDYKAVLYCSKAYV